jgi:hypothetical protein
MYDVNKILGNIAHSDLGMNAHHLYRVASTISNGIMVDLGVRCGNSSEIMLIGSVDRNNKVYGVDVTFDDLRPDLHNAPNYNKILGDSSTVGKEWAGEKVDVLFVDTFHIKEQVMCELYYWYPHMKNSCWFVFHDSNWHPGKYDVYGGITWDRVEDGIMSFFKTSSLNEKTDVIDCYNFPESWGMTFVHLKKKIDFPDMTKNWNEIISRRNHLMSLFWNKNNIGDRKIDLNLVP